MCSYHCLTDAEDFVDRWMAFSISNLGGAEPTLQYVNDFENKELKNQITNTKSKKAESSDRSKLKVYHQESDDEENDLLGNYVCITPKVSRYEFS